MDTILLVLVCSQWYEALRGGDRRGLIPDQVYVLTVVNNEVVHQYFLLMVIMAVSVATSSLNNHLE